MAYAVDTPRVSALPTSWISEMIEALKMRRAYRAAYMSTFKELSSMTDRELADIGLTRQMIRETARDAADMAFGK